jgi:cytoskeletal protein CcmA (bactofilin family)
VAASVVAKTVMVVGRISGNVSATERVEIQASGVVEGDISAPRLLVQEGAVVNGSIAMTGAKGAAASKPPQSPQTAPDAQAERKAG